MFNKVISYSLTLVNLCILLGITTTLWQARVMFFTHPPVPDTMKSPVAPAVVANPVVQDPVSWHLFDSEFLDLAPDESAKTDAQETPNHAGNGVLLGIVYTAENAQNNGAVLGFPGSEEQLYHPGDALPGGGQLVAVHADRVVLAFNGRQETWHFSQEKSIAGE